MAGSDSQPKKATPPKPAVNAPRKPLQVMHISRKTDKEIIDKESSKKDTSDQSKVKKFDEKIVVEEDKLTKVKYDIGQLDITLSQKGISYYDKKKLGCPNLSY